MVVNALPRTCICCGADGFAQNAVLWPELIAEWQLSPDEAAAVDLQQGHHCTTCGSNLRTMVLARAITRAFRGPEPFAAFVRTEPARALRVLEINEAGGLTQFLNDMPQHTLAEYPAVDITALPYEDGAFDLVCHSDTLEHVPQPVDALRECRRVLAPGGVLAYTVPIIPHRPTRRRDLLEPSYHAGPAERLAEFLVHTEYGDDAWHQVIDAGFDECRIVSIAAPIAYALLAVAYHDPE